MPNNRKAIIRYKVLDKCFCNKYHKFYIEELVDKCNDALYDAGLEPVSKKQIYDDIKFMKSREGYNAPIVSIQDGRRKYIRYSNDFSIHETPLTEMEVEQLQTLITSLSRYQGLPYYHWIEELLLNLRYRFGIHRDERDILGFEQNRDLKGLRYLADLINYTIKKQPIKISYHPFGQEICSWTLHPYYLKQYNNRWYLLGENHEFGELSIVALDRVEDVEPANINYIPNRDIDFSSYFHDIIGVSLKKGRESEHIVLKFAPHRLPYVISKPLHTSQYVENEETGIVSIDVIPNKELISEIIWFRDDVEILSPLSLREEVMNIIERMYKKYFGVKNGCTTTE